MYSQATGQDQIFLIDWVFIDHLHLTLKTAHPSASASRTLRKCFGRIVMSLPVILISLRGQES